jgi:hypothetical protein
MREADGMPNKTAFWSSAVKEFEFEVGESEKHHIRFRFNQSIGNLCISVDGRPVVRRFEMLSLSTTKRYSFEVGDREKHIVVIEKTRKRALGGFLPQKCVVYADGKTLREF